MGDIDEIIFSGYVVFFLKQVCQNRLVTKTRSSLLINQQCEARICFMSSCTTIYLKLLFKKDQLVLQDVKPIQHVKMSLVKMYMMHFTFFTRSVLILEEQCFVSWSYELWVAADLPENWWFNDFPPWYLHLATSKLLLNFHFTQQG